MVGLVALPLADLALLLDRPATPSIWRSASRAAHARPGEVVVGPGTRERLPSAEVEPIGESS